MSSPARLLLVDDHTMVRESLVRILERSGAEWQIREASNAFEALDRLRAGDIDLAVVDLSMPGMNGLDLIARMHAEHPEVRVLVLSMHAEEQYAIRAFKAGAMGYLTKSRAATELVAALRKIAAGSPYMGEALTELAMRELHRRPGHEQLSEREQDVFRRLAAGQRVTEIAAELELSVKTVSTHKTRIQEKLGVPTTAALIRCGMERGLAPGRPGGETTADPAAPDAQPT